MMRYPLSTLLAAALGTAALSSALAQGTASQPKSAPPASTKSAAKPTTTPSTKKATPKKATPSPTKKGDVVGSVNDQPITWEQLIDKMHTEYPADLNGSLSQVIAADATEALFGKNPKETFTITRSKAISDLRQHPSQKIVQVLELMLTTKSIDQEATRQHVQPTDQEVNDKVSAVLKDLRDKGVIPRGESDAQFLKEHNMTIEKLRTNYRPQVQVLNLVRKDTTATLGHPMGAPDLIQASHILIRVPDQPATATSEEKAKADADALAKITPILADIRANKVTFADAAKANSDDGSKASGGDLGIFTHGMMVKEFENAAFAAKPGVVTDPVKSKFGYHLILVTKTGTMLTPIERQKFIDEFMEKQVPNYVQKLREGSHVVDRLEALLPKQPNVGFGGPQGPRNAPHPSPQ